jgi:hypothetical protein
MAAQVGAGITVVPGDTRGYREGDIGWVASRAAFRLPDGTEVPARMTAVFRRESGDWKVVQGHASIGVGNEEATGVEF